jgi:hypothetical protein
MWEMMFEMESKLKFCDINPLLTHNHPTDSIIEKETNLVLPPVGLAGVR